MQNDGQAPAPKVRKPASKPYEAKTKPHAASVDAFIEELDSDRRKEEARILLALFESVTGEKPVLWGASIIGFGAYDYVYDSGHSGSAPLTGFSPRKAQLSIYIMPGFDAYGPLLSRLGKHKIGKSCLYVTALRDIDLAVLKDLIAEAFAAQKARWGVKP